MKTRKPFGRQHRKFPWLARPVLHSTLLLAAAYLGTLGTTHAQKIYSEDFESLALGPNVDEPVAGAHVWTETPPAGWTTDDSKMPGVGIPAQDGITEWAGWSFANKQWWIRADDQQRSLFALAQGTVMIADPDEWDDAFHVKGLFESTTTTGGIPLNGAPANSLVLVFDSSWRDEFKDDGLPNFPVDEEGVQLNNQTGFVTASFDGATATEILRWDSDQESPTFHDDAVSESVLIPLNNPAGAQSLVFKFGMEKAANDWWWAVDNIAVGIPPFLTGVGNDGVSITARIVEALGKTVDQSKGVVVEVDGTAVTPVTLTKEGDYLFVKYSQAPEVYPPKSRHTVKVKFTSSEGKALEDSADFIAPSYTAASSTPTGVTATITDAAVAEEGDTPVVEVDESKGVTFELDGVAVTAGTAVRTDAAVSATYTQTALFASASTHTLKVTFTTKGGKQVVDTVEFTSPPWSVVPTTLATDPGTGAQPGMRWRTHQLETVPSPPGRANTIAETEQQLAGTLGPSVHDVAGQGTDGYFLIDFVNFEQTDPPGDAGNFNSGALPPLDVADAGIPGIPGTVEANLNDYIAGEALAFVEISTTGLYTMVVNSDDGFQVSTGTATTPTALVLGAKNSAGGASDRIFYFRIDKAGVYFFRLVYFEGTGGASVEWFTVNADGSRALVGGTQTGSLKAYRVRTVPEPVAGGKINSITLTGGNLVIDYTGTLKSSAAVAGPFLPVTGATSPYTTTPTTSEVFFLAQ